MFLPFCLELPGSLPICLFSANLPAPTPVTRTITTHGFTGGPSWANSLRKNHTLSHPSSLAPGAMDSKEVHLYMVNCTWERCNPCPRRLVVGGGHADPPSRYTMGSPCPPSPRTPVAAPPLQGASPSNAVGPLQLWALCNRASPLHLVFFSLLISAVTSISLFFSFSYHFVSFPPFFLPL